MKIKTKTTTTTKENSKFTHPLPSGWLRPYLLALSDMFDGRWSYWLRTIDARAPLDEPIPQIKFDQTPYPDTKKNLKDCIEYMKRHGHGAHDAWMSFIDWLLWGFGTKIQSEFPSNKVTEEISHHWYTTFNLGLMMKYPADHMAWGSTELVTMSAGGYFPTPMHVCTMMAEMKMTKENKTSKTIDPVVGTGSMLLAASNHSLRLYAQDINLSMVKMCTVNGFIYIPWLVALGDRYINWHTTQDYEAAIKSFEEWQSIIGNPVPLITHQPRTNTLADWI